MQTSQKIAIAAHLHVLLRRKTGRVTDTEWMALNAEYAAEIVRFARSKAVEDGHVELSEWADKLAQALAEPPEKAQRPLVQSALAALRPPYGPRHPEFVRTDFGDSAFAASQNAAAPSPKPSDAPRYVGGLR
ncbi:MAG: hypothetical protein ACKVOO_10370 [Burkholderiaceae bacterium]